MPRAEIKVPMQQTHKRSWASPGSSDPIWTDDMPERVFRLCLLGLNNEQICLSIGIAVFTFDEWRRRYPILNRVMMAGREGADSAVAHSLFKRAVGYEHPEEKITFDARAGVFRRTETTKHYPPDTAAIQLWLVNRTREQANYRWQNTTQVNIGGPNGEALGPVTLNIVGIEGPPGSQEQE